MSKRLLVILCLLLASTSAWGLEKVTLQLKWKHQFQFAGYYAALQKGYFKDAGFDVQIKELEEGIDPVDSVVSGKADFGVGASELLLHRQNQPVVLLAVIFQHSPLVIITPRQHAGSIHDLVGKRVMLLPQERELYAFLAQEGIKPANIIAVHHSFDPNDLIAGKVDAMSGYSTDEPFLLKAQDFQYTIYSPRSSGIDFFGDNLFTSEARVRRSPEKAEAFRNAALKGWQYALAHVDEMIELIQTRYSRRHSREHLRFEADEIRHLMQPDLIEIGHINPGRWQHIADTYSSLGMLPADLALDGFFFAPGQRKFPLWLPYVLLAALLVVIVSATLAARFAHLNQQLHTQLAEIRTLHDLVREHAIRDSLTGLFNRRYLDETLERELARARRDGLPLSLIMLDLDYFKRLNDTYGHAAGDEVLKTLAAILLADCRGEDAACRFGGEEFLVLCPGMPMESARKRAENWRQRFAGSTMKHGQLSLNATASFGVATFPEHGHIPSDLVEAVDEALYTAKRRGRNRVELAPRLFSKLNANEDILSRKM